MKRPSLLVRLLLPVVLAVTGCSESSNHSRAEFLTLGEDRIYYEESGECFPLLLVSGGSGMDMRQWDHITPELAQAYRVIRYDPRGLGKSDNPSVTYSDADDLRSLLDHLGLDRVVLIGLSSSGGFVLEFAIQYPDRITGLVVAAPFVPGFEFSDSMLARLDLFNQAAEKGREVFLDSMFDDPHFIPAPLDRTVRVSARENMGQNFDKGANFDASLAIRPELPLMEQLSKIGTPVLLVAGKLDHPDVLRRNKFLTTRIPLTEEITISHAGHNAPQENPSAFLDSIIPFLQVIALTSFQPTP